MKLFGLAASAAAAAMIAGCSTPTIPITMNVAGEIKLNGVSKIALAEFNSLKGDPFTGTMAADAETCALVKRAVASAFYDSPMYQIVDFDAEDAIHRRAGSNALPDKRYDAVVYGRLWWQFTPETEGQVPQKYTLETWRNVPYVRKNPLTRKDEPAVAHVTTGLRDVVRMLDYRARNATLMLTLSLYRLEGSGEIVKIVDTYQVSSQGFTLMNGAMQPVAGSGEGQAEKQAQKGEDGRMRDANGKLLLTQNTVSMPTELQAKIMLAESVSRSLGRKLAPSKATFKVSADLGDEKLVNLLSNGAFPSARDYSLYVLRTGLGRQLCDRIADSVPGLVADESERVPYSVPDTAKDLSKFGEKPLGEFIDPDLSVYFYALGICEEAANSYDTAYEFYRFAFNLRPDIESARGIGRVQLAMGEAELLKQTRKARKNAAEKTALD